jgi:hypothetical protein
VVAGVIGVTILNVIVLQSYFSSRPDNVVTKPLVKVSDTYENFRGSESRHLTQMIQDALDTIKRQGEQNIKTSEVKSRGAPNYFANEFRKQGLGTMRKSIYSHELMDYGESFLHVNFSYNPFTTRCSEGAITRFKGPVIFGKCGSLISKDFVWGVNDFPQCIPDPRHCYDMYNEYFKKPLDTGIGLNQPLNVSELFLPRHNVTVRSTAKLVPIMFIWGIAFPHTIKDIMPKLVFALPYLAANPDAKMLIDGSKYVRGYVKRLGIPDSRIMWTRDQAWSEISHYGVNIDITYVATEELALPHCHPGPFGTGTFSSEMHFALRDLLVKEPHLPEHERNLILYVARDGGTNYDAQKGFMRRLDNEAVVLEKLNSTIQEMKQNGVFEKFGQPEPEFLRFIGFGMSLDEQIALFRRARVVFGPHGGGFYNLLYSAPGTHVIELSPDDYGKYEVARLSINLGFDHNGYIKKGMLRNETFGDIDVEWMVSEVLYNYAPQLVNLVSRPVVPHPYVRINRQEMADYSALKNLEE